jgi:hypothetical protein
MVVPLRGIQWSLCCTGKQSQKNPRQRRGLISQEYSRENYRAVAV